MRDITDIIVDVSMEINTLRQLLSIIRSDRFRRVYKGQVEADHYVFHRRVYELKVWIRQQLRDDLETYHTTELRQLAKDLEVENYQSLDKERLIGEICLIREKK